MNTKYSGSGIKLIAMDLDGTITQHKSKLEPFNHDVLEQLSKHYQLVIVGAGSCLRIYDQLNSYPIDIIGYYGMQRAGINSKTGEFELIKNITVEIDDKFQVEKQIYQLREMLGCTKFSGDSVEFHDSGMITFPLLGTTAKIVDKLKFDPLREKRRKVYSIVKEMFSEYTVFIGGSSSFDIVPLPYNKLHALNEYTSTLNLEKQNIVYIGDDYGLGGNDEHLYHSDIQFICIDNYKELKKVTASFLKI